MYIYANINQMTLFYNIFPIQKSCLPWSTTEKGQRNIINERNELNTNIQLTLLIVIKL